MDIVERLRECATDKAGEAWRRIDGGQDLCIGSMLAEEAADEIERLRAVLVAANNNWRHEFSKEVEDAADKLFTKLAAHRTDPFARKVA